MTMRPDRDGPDHPSKGAKRSALSTSRIDRHFPYQVELPAAVDSGDAAERIDEFCRAVNAAPRGRWFRKSGAWHVRRCFAHLEDAETFRREFGGELFDLAQGQNAPPGIERTRD